MNISELTDAPVSIDDADAVVGGFFDMIELTPATSVVTVLTEPPEPNPMAERNFENRTLFHSDNLPILRAMNSESVDLIATDPPFNKSRDFHATPDSLAAGVSFQDRWSWERDVHEDWTDQITDDHPRLMEAIESARYAHSDGMGAFMCFMAVRLLAMHRVLKPTGSIYLHCDHTASHYLKAVMDAVFGWRNFRNEIIHRRNESGVKGSQHSPKTWGANSDSLLFYAKGEAATFDPLVNVGLTEAEIVKKFPNVDENGERYKTKPSAWRQPSMGARPNLCYAFRGIKPPFPSGWRLEVSRMEEEYRKGNIVITDGKLERRSYVKDYVGVSPGNLWTESELLLPAQSGERMGYPTQKPLALYERIVNASSNEGDMVLDPFAGCATTCIAAEKLRRQWVGIDIWDNARLVVLDRLRLEGLIADPKEKLHGRLFTEDVHFTETPPTRTDDTKTASPNLRTKVTMFEPRGSKMTRAEMYKHLLEQHGSKCQGCDRTFDDPRYLQLDHNTPRADGGLNHISNRVLLCGPCNQLKSHVYTLSGLRRENRKRGFMYEENRR